MATGEKGPDRNKIHFGIGQAIEFQAGECFERKLLSGGKVVATQMEFDLMQCAQNWRDGHRGQQGDFVTHGEMKD